jgi:hypothetical protein
MAEKKKQTTNSTEAFSDLLGLGDIAKASASSINKRVELEEVKTEESTKKLGIRETTERKRIDAAVKTNEIVQKYATKRHDQQVKQASTFINESDQIISSLDNTIYERTWRLKRGGTAKLKISSLSFMLLTAYCGPLIRKLFGDEPGMAGLMHQNSQKMMEFFKHLVDHSENLHRTASAGSMNFAAPYYQEPEVISTDTNQTPTDPVESTPLEQEKRDTQAGYDMAQKYKEMMEEQNKQIQQKNQEKTESLQELERQLENARKVLEELKKERDSTKFKNYSDEEKDFVYTQIEMYKQRIVDLQIKISELTG